MNSVTASSIAAGGYSMATDAVTDAELKHTVGKYIATTGAYNNGHIFEHQ